MTEVKLTAAQERVLRQAVTGGAYHLFGPRRASCDRLTALGFLRPSFAAGEEKAFMWIPTTEGEHWVESHEGKPR